MPAEQKRYYRPDEMAKMLNVSRSMVYFWIRNGQVKAKRFGKLYRIPKSEYCRMCSGGNECAVCSHGPR